MLVGSILLYRSYALYKEEKTFNVIRGKVPSFVTGDLEIAISLDGESKSTFPEKGAYDVSVVCDKGATGYWDYEGWGPFIQNLTENKTKCTIQFKTGKYFSDMIIDISNTSSSVVRIDHEATEQTPNLTEYRYVGKTPNNYVCFGSETNPCPDNNLYRIIGVIPAQSSENGEYENRVKLIKATNWVGSNPTGYIAGSSKYGEGYYWYNSVTSAINDWATCTVKTVLNGEYYNSLGNYQKYIDLTNWKLGGLPTAIEKYNVKEIYTLERGNKKGASSSNLNYSSYIGVMYMSDYGYSLSGGTNNEKWNQSLNGNLGEYQSNAWLQPTTLFEWFISPISDSTSNNAAYTYTGLGATPVRNISYIAAIRPTFHLKASIKYKSGDGTSSNPYRIGL